MVRNENEVTRSAIQPELVALSRKVGVMKKLLFSLLLLTSVEISHQDVSDHRHELQREFFSAKYVHICVHFSIDSTGDFLKPRPQKSQLASSD